MGNKASSNKQNSHREAHGDDDDESADFASSPLPDSIEKILATKMEKETESGSLHKFGGALSEQPLVVVGDFKIPYTLAVLQKYLKQFNGRKLEGIFVNGLHPMSGMGNPLEFIPDGAVSMDDCLMIQKLIENDKITMKKLQIPNYNNDDKFYAMVFGELIKLWLKQLDEPLLQTMPSTFFDGITCVEFLELDINDIPDPQYSSLLFLWDICVWTDAENEENKMNANLLSKVFAPYLYREEDEERNAQIVSSLTNYFELGIQWRQKSK